MAISNIQDFKVYDEEFQGGVIETLTQNANAFNEATGGTIRLVTDDMLGNYKKEAFWQSIGSSMVARQDVTSNAAQTALKLTQSEFVDVKVFRKITPIEVTHNAFDEIGGDADGDASFIIGKQVGVVMALEMLNTILAASVAAINNQSATNALDVTAATTKHITHSNLLDAIALMGDNHQKIKAFVMHSRQWFDLQKQGLADGYETIATGILNAHYVPAFGRVVVVTDSASLINTTPTPDSYYVLGLVESAARCSRIGGVRMVSDLITGQEQLGLRFQGEYKYSLGLKGFAYDATNGGANPNAAALATGTNWDKAATSYQDLAGVCLTVQARP